MSTWAFDYLAELIRAELQTSESAARIPHIYRGKDEACLNFISVFDEAEPDFYHFYRAAENATKRAMSEHQGFEKLCDELLSKLRADARFASTPIHPR